MPFEFLDNKNPNDPRPVASCEKCGGTNMQVVISKSKSHFHFVCTLCKADHCGKIEQIARFGHLGEDMTVDIDATIEQVKEEQGDNASATDKLFLKTLIEAKEELRDKPTDEAAKILMDALQARKAEYMKAMKDDILSGKKALSDIVSHLGSKH